MRVHRLDGLRRISSAVVSIGEAVPVWNGGYPGHTAIPVFLGAPFSLDWVTGWWEPFLFEEALRRAGWTRGGELAVVVGELVGEQPLAGVHEREVDTELVETPEVVVEEDVAYVMTRRGRALPLVDRVE